jgi:hypothetical protein
VPTLKAERIRWTFSACRDENSRQFTMLQLGNIFQAATARARDLFEPLNILAMLVDGHCFRA